MTTTYRTKKIFGLLWCLFALPLNSCEKILSSKLTSTPIVDEKTFANTIGLELPYRLYMPSSMMGWELSGRTELRFNNRDRVYTLDAIPIDQPLLDDKGYRFKLCGNGWLNQFGFGTNITDIESTFGVPAEGVVVQVEQFDRPVTDLRVEFPLQDNSTHQTKRYMRAEFKLLSLSPNPKGLLRMSIYR